MNGRLCEGRVVIVTGGGRGLGRAHALALAAEGATVVVNDLGVTLDGSAPDGCPAAAVVDEIGRSGGRAIANTDDVATWTGAQCLIRGAVDAFGRLDGLVCNAGTLLDRDLVDMSESNWDSVITTHLKGHAAPLHHAARHWRAVAEQTGDSTGGRVVLTASTAGIWGDAGRTNYNAAKAGIVLLGRTAAIELARDGVCVNVIAPFARTRMTISLDAGLAAAPTPDRFDPVDPANASPLVVWLCSDESAGVNGEVFEVHAGHLGIVQPPRRGPHVEVDHRWLPAELGAAVDGLLASRPAAR